MEVDQKNSLIQVRYSSTPYHRSAYYINDHPYGLALYYYYYPWSSIEKPSPLMFISSQSSSSSSSSISWDNQTGNSPTEIRKKWFSNIYLIKTYPFKTT
jgi:hypothetical protein